MRVVHINKLLDGGAAWCAIRINNALQRKGLESSMIVMDNKTGNIIDSNITIAERDLIYRTSRNFLLRMIMKIIKILIRPSFEYYKYKRIEAEKHANIFFTSPLTEYKSLVKHPLVKNADIIHLHWVSDFVDFPSFFKNIDKPVVWTIHDENPGLGGFHYSLQKKNAPKEYLNLDKKYEEIKRKAINGRNRPYLVAISEKMRIFFKNNKILGECPVTLIHNGVDGESFVKKDRILSRKKLQLPLDKKIFLFSSYKIDDPRKGLSLLLDALSYFHDDSFLLVCLGKCDNIPSTCVNIRCEGLITGNEMLSMYYSAADFFILSSFQEAFAQTPLESMSCGTPVIAFPCSGVPELINEQNGIICDDFTVEALIKGIKEALGKTYNRDDIRKYVLSHFSYDIIAQQYIQLYNKVLTDTKTRK